MQKMKNPAGRRGLDKGVERFQGWLQCFMACPSCQDLAIVAVIVAGAVLI